MDKLSGVNDREEVMDRLSGGNDRDEDVGDDIVDLGDESDVDGKDHDSMCDDICQQHRQ